MLRHARHQRRHASHVGRIGRLADVSQDDFVNAAGINARALNDFLEHNLGKVLGTHVAQRAAVRPAGRPNAADQNNILHGYTPF
jgi:hypothetical protein